MLRGVADMANQAIHAADASEFWRIPTDGQRDPITAARLAALMLEHGVEVRLAQDKKSFLIATAQPYGRFVEEMLGVQRYPEVKPAPNSGILEPYDVAAWSLPLMMGVKAEKVRLSAAEQNGTTQIKQVPWPEGGLEGKGPYYSTPDDKNNVAALINAMQKAGGQVFISKSAQGAIALFAAHPQLAANAEKLHLRLQAVSALPAGAAQIKPVRVALYKSYVPSLDEGWTRFLLEQYGFPVKNIENKEVRAGNLNASWDVMILPDSSREAIVEGKATREGYLEELPPEYTGGIGKEGLRALRDFVEKGGTVITLARAAEALIGDEFNLPVRNTLTGATTERRGVSVTEFNIPGSLLRVYLDPNHPVNWGLPAEVAGFYDGPIAFQTSAPGADIQREVIAWFPENAKDILVSGYARGAERLERKAAAVSFKKGKGKIVMFGFRVQHRAQTEGTFQMLFNAIFWAGM